MSLRLYICDFHYSHAEYFTSSLRLVCSVFFLLYRLCIVCLLCVPAAKLSLGKNYLELCTYAIQNQLALHTAPNFSLWVYIGEVIKWPHSWFLSLQNVRKRAASRWLEVSVRFSSISKITNTCKKRQRNLSLSLSLLCNAFLLLSYIYAYKWII